MPDAKVIGELLKDEDTAVRHAAIVGLGCLGHEASSFQEELLAQLQDSSASIRCAALVTVGGLRAAARPNAHHIEQLLHDEKPACRRAAALALKCIGVNPSVTRMSKGAWMLKKLRRAQRKISKLENVAQPLSNRRAKKIERLMRLQDDDSALEQSARKYLWEPLWK